MPLAILAPVEKALLTTGMLKHRIHLPFDLSIHPALWATGVDARKAVSESPRSVQQYRTLTIWNMYTLDRSLCGIGHKD